MNACFRTLPLAVLLGLALVAGCDPKSPKVTEDSRPPTGEREQATGTVTGSTGTATGTGGAGSTTTPGTPSGTLPEASGPAVSAGSEPTAGRSTGTPLGAGAGVATGGATPSDSHDSTAGEPGRATGGGAGTAAPPGVAVPSASAASMAAGAGDLAQGAPAASSSRTQAAPGGDTPSKEAKDGNETSATPLNSTDRTFVQTTAGLGLYEMAAARLGQERAKSPDIKDFAQRIERDHAKAQEQLQRLADQHRIELPKQMPSDRQRVIERLERAEPFDTAFVNTVGVQDHQSSIERFEKAARDAKDPELKAWIQQNLKSLRTHLAQARKLPGADGR
ncbi:DUF4142 domain-containing protein [uncultured Azohydromonas sp.]|uniref:DUF4142 domain-containing protein n=1 Tax=uncultured Azohydromonas sp. TaxID=487342 RepID=UPI00260F58F5|nr:DUF4142 domain-containing protein [uncultured Azohydromonas sp.]